MVQVGTSSYISLDGPGGAMRVRSTAEPQVRRGKDTMAIGTTNDDTAERGVGGVHNSQGIGGQNTATKSGERRLDITGDLSVSIPEERNS